MVPGFRFEPLQAGQVSARLSLISRSTPAAASSRPISTSSARSRPRLRRLAPAALPSAEEVAEAETEQVPQDVLEILEDGRIESGEALIALAPQPVVSEAVVDGPLLGVGQDAVGLGGFLEPLLGLLAPGIAVGMVFQGELTVRFLDLFGRGVPGDAQDLVVILLSHGLPAWSRPGPSASSASPPLPWSKARTTAGPRSSAPGPSPCPWP